VKYEEEEHEEEQKEESEEEEVKDKLTLAVKLILPFFLLLCLLEAWTDSLKEQTGKRVRGKRDSFSYFSFPLLQWKKCREKRKERGKSGRKRG
jgi:hypothetical protein